MIVYGFSYLLSFFRYLQHCINLKQLKSNQTNDHLSRGCSYRLAPTSPWSFLASFGLLLLFSSPLLHCTALTAVVGGEGLQTLHLLPNHFCLKAAVSEQVPTNSTMICQRQYHFLRMCKILVPLNNN